MSDRLTALKLLVGNAAQETADAALSHFRKTYANEPDSIIEWLRVQGASDRPGNLKNLQRLLSSPSLFDMRDTEAVVALLNEGLANSAVNFEAADGSGYKFLFDAILQVSVYMCVRIIFMSCMQPLHSTAPHASTACLSFISATVL